MINYRNSWQIMGRFEKIILGITSAAVTLNCIVFAVNPGWGTFFSLFTAGALAWTMLDMFCYRNAATTYRTYYNDLVGAANHIAASSIHTEPQTNPVLEPDETMTTYMARVQHKSRFTHTTITP